MSKPKNVAIYLATLLNGDVLKIKNNDGEKLSKVLSKKYIKGFSFYKSCDRETLKSESVDYDLDRMRSLKDIHKDLVLKIYLQTEGSFC